MVYSPRDSSLRDCADLLYLELGNLSDTDNNTYLKGGI